MPTLLHLGRHGPLGHRLLCVQLFQSDTLRVERADSNVYVHYNTLSVCPARSPRTVCSQGVVAAKGATGFSLILEDDRHSSNAQRK